MKLKLIFNIRQTNFPNCIRTENVKIEDNFKKGKKFL